MSERRLTTEILKALRERWPEGWWVKVHGGPMQQAGVPDILGCVEGRFVALEVKHPDGNHPVTALQEHTLKEISEAEGIAAVVRSVDEAKDAVRQRI